MRHGPRQRANAGANRCAQQHRPANHRGDHSTSRGANRATGECALLLMRHP